MRFVSFCSRFLRDLASIHRMCGKSGLWAVRTLLSFLVLAVTGGACAEHPNEAPVAPAVVSVTQLTHDGASKTSLLADDSNLYVTEWRSARHVVTKFSLPGGDGSLIPSKFSSFQALDISPDHKNLLVAPMQGGSDGEFWTLPVKAGSPRKLGELGGRDASWSADGRQLVIGKGSSLYIANSDGSEQREIYTADGSVFSPHFSLDGKRIRFTVGNTA